MGDYDNMKNELNQDWDKVLNGKAQVNNWKYS